MTSTSLRERAPAAPDAIDPDVPGRSLTTRIVRGRPDDPAWARPALLGLLAATAVLYLWDLGANGYSNDFYAAAVQAASVSWKAWFFGSFDASSFITVDKPPAAMWVMGLSGRIFGFSTWSMLAPQVLLGLGAVGLLYGAVKRWHGAPAGLAAGAALALTPAAALMFRFNNPDALLTFLLVAGAYCVVRALEKASTAWILAAGSLIGFAFLTKMLQAFLVLPAFALVYLICAPTSFRRRLLQSIGALVAVVVSCGWWIAVVELLPASARPYVGGSQNNSILELVFGYNGFGRLLGGDGNGGGGGGGAGGGNAGFGGATGITRLFRDEMGFEISWLLPAALIALVAGLLMSRREPRIRASMILWGGWLVVTGLTFSFMQGTVHPYYTVALAPAVAALVAIMGAELWKRRDDWFARSGLALMIFASGLWSYTLLARNDTWLPGLRVIVLVVTVLTTLGLLVPGRIAARVLVALVLVGTLGGAAGTAAYGVTTAHSAHSGSIPSVGPTSAQSAQAGQGGSSTSSTEVTQLLQNAGTTWAAAAIGSQSAATLQLAGGEPVMAIGGFTGSDPAPTLAGFQQLVAAGEVRYFVSGGGGGGGRGGNSEISTWVSENYTATTVGGYTVYDLRN